MKTQPHSTLKFALLSTLYTSQFLPSAFFFQALPIFLRQQGASLQVIGLMGLLTLPWLLKFLWAPLVDLWGSRKWGHYKSWVVVTQSLLILTLLTCSSINVGNNNAVNNNATNNEFLLFQGIFLIITFAATQDIATDALAIKLLAPQERGWGNGIQSAGRAMGGILGGGVMLLALNRLGWQLSLWILAGSCLVALVPLLWYRETSQATQNLGICQAGHHTADHLSFSDSQPALPRLNAKAKPFAAYFETLLSFLRQAHIQSWLLFILIYVTGGSMAATMFRPLLVDIGLSMADIGWMTGIVGSAVAIVGSLVAGGLIQPLGRRRALIVFGLVQSIAILALTLPALGLHHPFVLYAVSSGEVLARSLTSTALFTLMMDKSRQATAGSDYTLQSSVFIVGHHLGIPSLSGFIAAAVGYTRVFLLAAGICLVSVWLATRLIRETPPEILPETLPETRLEVLDVMEVKSSED
jgi:predicted MFS family arabinose efflux permease